jgi:DNA gyrase subunit A
VTLINLDEGTFLASVEKVAESEADESMRASGEATELDGADVAPVADEGEEGEAPAGGEEGEV